jgi:hypothetical protein
MMLHAIALLALFILPARAAQKAFEVDKNPQRWAFEVRWTDAEGARHQASFELPTTDVRADLDEPLRYKVQDANRYMVAEIRTWASDRKGPKITAQASGGAVRISATGKSRAKIKESLAEAAEVRDAAAARYRQEHGFTTIDGAIAPDHIRHVREYADDLAPVIAALGGPGDDPRSFASLALGFVQSIPYEQASKQRDRYRRPLSLLGRNRGDCDSKSTLFLALMHQAWPELELAMVYIPGHAFVGLGIEPEQGEAKLNDEDRSWLLAEPVGPDTKPLGEVGKKSRRKARRGRVDTRVLTHDG